PRPGPALAAPPAVPAAPTPRTPSHARSPRVVGYATVNTEDDVDAATAALALRCAHQDWSLLGVIREQRRLGRRLRDRPGLMYALNTIRSRRATGLIVARIVDFTAAPRTWRCS